MKPQELNLNSEVFGDFREKFDAALAVMVRQMAEKRMPEGTLAVSVTVKMGQAATADGEIIRTIGIEPDMKMKIGAKAKVECEKRGVFCVQMDPEGKPIVASSQIDMDEFLGEDQEGA